MDIDFISIRNLRCIDFVELRPQRYTTLIGPNNSGKSSVLRALELFLTNSSAELDEWRHGHEEHPIEIRVRFNNITPWERNRPGISGLVNDNQIDLKVKMTRTEAGGRSTVTKDWEVFASPEIIEGWGANWTDLSDEIKALAGANTINGTVFRRAEGKEALKALVRRDLPNRVTIGEPQWTTEGISITNAFQQGLPLVQMIPALRDPVSDSKPGSKSSFGSILKQIVMPAMANAPEYQDVMQAVDRLRHKLGQEGPDALQDVAEAMGAINRRLASLIEARVQIGMETPDAEKMFAGSTTLRVGDGLPTRVELQGHGLQRALVFAMLELLATQEVAVAADPEDNGHVAGRSVVLLFEEPELYIHPQLLRKLSAVLQSIAGNGRWQVFATTHSPILVDVASNPRSLIISKRNAAADAPRFVQVETDPFAGREEDRERLRAFLTFHPTACEAFFAKRVVLVEGDSEIAITRASEHLSRRLGIDTLSMLETCVVSCAGKWTIPPMATILREFGVAIRVIHDLDQKGRNLAEIPAGPDPFNANARILAAVGNDPAKIRVSIDRLETILWEGENVPASDKQKAFRAYRRSVEICDTDDLWNRCVAFRELVDFVFRW